MSRLLKIGIFVLITGVGTVLYVMRTAETIDAKETYLVDVFMDDASGLLVDTNVRLAGVAVGKIRAIQLFEGKAKLTLELSTDVKLYEDAKIVKTLESMLGVSAISVYPGEKVDAPIRAGGIIQNSVSTSMMEQTFLGASTLTDEATMLIKELRKFLSDDGGYSTLKEILQTTRDMTKTTGVLVERNLVLLASAMQDISEITRRLNVSSRDDVEKLSAILKSTADITDRIERLMANNEGNIQETLVNVKDSVAQARDSIEKLDRALEQVHGVAAKINSGEGNLGKLIHDDKLYDKVVNITGNVEEYVNSTIGLDLQVAFQSDFLINQFDARNQFGLRLTPRGKDKYYSLAFVDTPRLSMKEVITRTVITGATPPDATDYTIYETEKRRQLLINAQIARRFGLFTLRGGVLESTGGLGIDFQPHDKIALSAEIFDFGQTGAPFLRASGTLYPFFDPSLSNPLNWIYLSGGVDNILHNDRDYFFGLGLRFRDNDLKGVAGFIPTK
jgi:phospholipid/cholesterol/gamma-HCH transport system substrate-binding protein